MSENSNLKPFAQVLREFRRNHNLTLDELSKLVRIPAQTLNRYELGQRIPKVDVVNEMAIRLGVNPMYMLGYDQFDEFQAFVDIDLPPGKISNMGVFDLAEEEKDLLIAYRRLNEAGQKKTLEYTKDLLDSAKYCAPPSQDTVDQQDSNPTLYRARTKLGLTNEDFPIETNTTDSNLEE